MASSLGARIDVEHPIGRFLLTLVFFHVHNAVFVLTERVLLAQHEPYHDHQARCRVLVNRRCGGFISRCSIGFASRPDLSSDDRRATGSCAWRSPRALIAPSGKL